jgi:hypothetical protein
VCLPCARTTMHSALSPPTHTQLMGPAAGGRGRVALLGNGRTGQRVVQQPRGGIGTGR